MLDEFDAVIVAGGRARRLGGVDKAVVVVHGRTLLDHVVDAVAHAQRTVVVGARRVGPTRADAGARCIAYCREEPPGSGPLAAVAAGVARTRAPVVVLLAADLPFIAGALPGLLAAVRRGSGRPAVLRDRTGRSNLLASAWPAATLRTALDHIGDPCDQPMRRLIETCAWVDVDDTGRFGDDCDTWADVRSARDRLEADPVVGHEPVVEPEPTGSVQD